MNPSRIEEMFRAYFIPRANLEKGNQIAVDRNTKKYASMTNTSIPTAKRDIPELVGYGLIKQVEGSAGRNTRYVIKF